VGASIVRGYRSALTGTLPGVPAEIAVVGSLNLDTTVRVERLPAAGETVLAADHFSDSGGKGANQAVAAARLGRSVAMIGMVGPDDAGASLVASLAASGVDTSAVAVAPGTGTGIAVITVADSAENTIVVDAGANGLLDADRVRAASDALAAAVVTLAQLEIPLDGVAAAAELSGGTFILNPAPAAPLPPDLLRRVDVLVPNATELGTLCGRTPPADAADAGAMAATLEGPKAVVVTLGASGAVVVVDGETTAVPAPVVTAVDPTAAGDAFCGGLADALVRGLGLVDAVRWAVRCGAVAATRFGAQASLPTRADAEGLEDR